MSDLIQRLQNKISYMLYKSVNDDDANTYAEQKKADKEEKTESYDDVPPATTDPITDSSANAPTDQLRVSRIYNKVIEYLQTFYTTYFYYIIAIFVASLVANDLIMYPASMRAIFFVAVLIICISSTFIAGAGGLYYVIRKAYELYVNRKRDDQPSQFIRIMPKIFALLPLITYDPNRNGLLRFLLYPFIYVKDTPSPAEEPNAENNLSTRNSKKKEAVILDEIMKQYLDALNEGFSYYTKIKTEPIFARRQREMDKMIDEMHAVPELSQEVPEVSQNTAKTNTLPPVIGVEPPTNTGQKNTLPPVIGTPQIQNTAKTNTLPPVIGTPQIQNTGQKNTLPPVIGAE
jgi:hypothetical protein